MYARSPPKSLKRKMMRQHPAKYDPKAVDQIIFVLQNHPSSSWLDLGIPDGSSKILQAHLGSVWDPPKSPKLILAQFGDARWIFQNHPSSSWIDLGMPDWSSKTTQAHLGSIWKCQMIQNHPSSSWLDFWYRNCIENFWETIQWIWWCRRGTSITIYDIRCRTAPRARARLHLQDQELNFQRFSFDKMKSISFYVSKLLLIGSRTTKLSVLSGRIFVRTGGGYTTLG